MENAGRGSGARRQPLPQVSSGSAAVRHGLGCGGRGRRGAPDSAYSEAPGRHVSRAASLQSPRGLARPGSRLARSLAPPASDQAPVWPPPGCAISNGISLVRLPTRPSTVPPGRSHSPSLCTPPFLLLPASVPHVPSRQGLLPPSPGPGAGTSPQDFILLQVSKAGPRGSPLACVLWEWTRPLGWIRHPSCLAHTVCLGF